MALIPANIPEWIGKWIGKIRPAAEPRVLRVSRETDLILRPWAELTTDELLDRLEWSYSESETFEPEVVWELARRATEDSSSLK